MLLINPARAETLSLLPADTLPACLDSFPGGPLLALSTDGTTNTTTLATATHCGVVLASEEGHMIHWYQPCHHYAVQYNETLRCWQVTSVADEYAIPADHTPIYAGFGALLVMQYTRNTARVGGPGNDGHTLYRLSLPHTLDGLPGMFQTEEE